jgi:hypothetical protein
VDVVSPGPPKGDSVEPGGCSLPGNVPADVVGKLLREVDPGSGSPEDAGGWNSPELNVVSLSNADMWALQNKQKQIQNSTLLRFSITSNRR